MMLQGYDIVLDGQLGQRQGTLRWVEDHGTVTGTLSLLGFDNPVQGQREGCTLRLFHELRTAVSVWSCRTLAEMQGDALCGVVLLGRSRIRLRGQRQRAEPGDSVPTA